MLLVRCALNAVQRTFHSVPYSTVLFLGAAFSWAHTPSPQLDTAVGSNVTLRWDFEESINESFIFLLVTRFHGQNLANDTILAQRVGNQTIVLPEYEGRVFLKEKATLVLYNVTWSDEMTYCCNVYCTDVAESDCIELTVQGKSMSASKTFPPLIVVVSSLAEGSLPSSDLHRAVCR